MSTERKPGSRGVTTTFAGNPKRGDSAFDHDRNDHEVESGKGSTKTKPRAGAKKRKRK